MQLADFVSQVEDQTRQDELEKKTESRHGELVESQNSTGEDVTNAIQDLKAFQAQHKPEVSVTNQLPFPTSIKTPDIQKVVTALNSLKEVTSANQPDNTTIIEAVSALREAINELPSKIVIPEMPEPIEDVNVKNQIDYKPDFKSLQTAIENKDTAPQVKVAAPKVTIPLDEVVTQLVAVQTAVKGIKIPEAASIDFSDLSNAITEVKSAIQAQRFPVPNYVLPFRDSQGKAVQVQLDANGNVPLGGQPATPTVTVVGDSITSGTLIAANSSRKEVEFFNGSTAILYLLKGTGTASTSNYTVQVLSGGYYTTNITGAFTGIWASDAGGSVFITESV